MEYLDADMEDFCGEIRRLIDWLNCAESIPVTFAEPGFRQDLVTAPQPFIELYLVTEGSLGIEVGGTRARVPDDGRPGPVGEPPGESVILRPGDMAIANAHFGNQGREVAGPFRYGCISFELPARAEFAHWALRPFLQKRRIPDLDRITGLYVEIARLFHGPEHPYREILLKAALLQLLAHAGDTGAGQASSVGLQNVHVRRATEFMQERRAEAKLNLSRIARYARVSPSHLVRLFQSHLGTSPMRYLTQVRVRHAQGLLVRSQLTIKEIAFLTGFSDQLYFSRVFRNETGSAPREYRRRAA